MINAIAIFLGGGLGAVSRYLLSTALRDYSFNYPIATFIANILGSLILGFTIAFFWSKAPMHQLHHTARVAITVGFCGGLTTFSTFSWEAFDLIKQGDYLLALLYVIISVVVCVLAVGLGVFLAKYV